MTRGVLFAGALALGISACSPQASAYNQSLVCQEAKTSCKLYQGQRKTAGKKPEGEGLRLLREDCEASQRACAESVENLQPSLYPEDRPMRSWQDALWK